MSHRVYRVIKADELDRAIELEYYKASLSEVDPSLMVVKNDNDDEELEDLTVPTQSSLFDGWVEFPFASHDQVRALTQDPAWSVLKDMDNSDRRWAT